ncbi:RNA pol II accessory factor, Cdc73 family-domain-containing protein [Irpex rosettiformis]|uniref:RNA pol II accessory factor, Cdc73 family-domain-containing protein n=1 Tax=Irpex rosettiformis TaxID=378272 RepID=A0ACB8TV42_9APHY|nr:RNA pol II accessory factor, Cdc73 family-domain-containing protein [Irpex rosettiformis]
MSATDALLALRNSVRSKTRITYANGSEPTTSLATASHIVLSPKQSLPKSSPTRLRKPGTTSTDPSANPQDFYTLHAVYLAWHLRDAHGAEYLKQTRENGLSVGFISITDRKSIVDWLEGRVNDLESIVPTIAQSTTPPGSPTRGPSTLPATPATSKPVDSSSSPTKRRYVTDSADYEAVKKIKLSEIELRDRTTVLHGIKANNFTNVKNMFQEKLKKLKDGGKTAALASSASDPALQAKKSRSQNYPIIVISSSPTSLITMHNVKRFLQDSTFETSQDARARAVADGNPRPEDMIPIYRRRTTIDSSGKETVSQARYYVVDSTEALSKFGQDAWDRVVCVMTTGQAWQFKPYKWNDPKVLFHHVKGIYLSLTSEPPNPKIKDWNVTELKIDANRRHVDKSVVAQFWKTLDAWTLANKPWLVK